MEKIIAVVVMIAIVIGLIARAVLPMVGQMNEQGGAASSQLDMIGSTVTDSSIRIGSTVVSEINSLKSKFSLTSGKLESITLDGTACTAATGIESLINSVDTGARYTRKDEYHGSGAIKTVTYTKAQ